jgi:hypothetical protein
MDSARLRAVFAILLGTALGALPAGAQELEGVAAAPEIRPATFWWDASLGSGSLQVSCDICADAVDSGVFAEVAAGAYATSRLAVGVEFGGWTHLDGETREEVYQGALTFRYARNHARGLHFLAGAGWLSYRAEDFRYGAPRVHMGLGWSIPVSSHLSVGNRLVWDVAPFGSLNNQDTTVAEGVRMGLLRFAVFIRSN